MPHTIPVVGTHTDNFNSGAAGSTTTTVFDVENVNPTTSTCGKERLQDQSRESIWHDADEYVGGEEGGEGGAEERVQERWDDAMVETILSFQNHKR